VRCRQCADYHTNRRGTQRPDWLRRPQGSHSHSDRPTSGPPHGRRARRRDLREERVRQARAAADLRLTNIMGRPFVAPPAFRTIASGAAPGVRRDHARHRLLPSPRSRISIGACRRQRVDPSSTRLFDPRPPSSSAPLDFWHRGSSGHAPNLTLHARARRGHHVLLFLLVPSRRGLSGAISAFTRVFDALARHYDVASAGNARPPAHRPDRRTGSNRAHNHLISSGVNPGGAL